MNAPLAVRELTIEAAEWDRRVDALPTSTVFHSSAWLDYLVDSQGGSAHRSELLRGDERIGLLCGVRLRKGPFNVYGSPLRGWWTVSMGPVLEAGVRPDLSVLGGIDEHLRASGIHYAEMSGLDLPDDSMRALAFETEPFPTLWVPLRPEPEAMFGRMTSTCRNRVRKAQKNGLRAEVATDEGFADDFYDQMSEVFGRQGTEPTRSREAVRTLCRHLIPSGRAIALRILTRDGDLAATGVFPIDRRFIYFLGGASTDRFRDLCPNELLHWEAMRLGAERGADRYDMGGGWTRFKEKFGGERVTIHRWRKGYSALAMMARNAYRAAWYARRSLRARFGGGPRAHNLDNIQ